MQVTRAFLVMLDISGYTRFMRMHATSLLHAEEIISDLLEAVLEKADFPLTIAKLEGDAVFLYAKMPEGGETTVAQGIARQIATMFEGFYARERALLDCRHGCVCEACANIGQLKLKAILHAGEVAIKQIRQFTELAGQDVILIHRLLKNSIPTREYVLMTPFFHTLSGDYDGKAPERRREQVDDFGATDVLVYYPGIAAPESATTVKGTALAARLNRHSFARLLGVKSRGEYHHLPAPRLNLVAYLLEGIASGVNVLRRRFGGKKNAARRD